MDAAEASAKLIKCINFAAIKHRDQRRLDAEKTPYINHPIGVAHILTEEAKLTDDINVIQAALLHDTVEDTDTTFEELREVFGDDVTNLVQEATDDKSLPYRERKRLQIETAAHHTPRARLVKLADKLYNLRDLRKSTPSGWSETRVQEYFEWAAKVVKGLRGVNQYMEDQLDAMFEERGVLHLAR